MKTPEASYSSLFTGGRALLTGDLALRTAAEAQGIEAHVTLEVLDRLEQTAKRDPGALHAG